MSRLEMRFLGGFQVTLDGQPTSGFESDKARALLAYLAVEKDRAHRRERLAGLLWPEYPEHTARAYLRRVLANLRSVIRDEQAEPPFLIIDRQSIQFNQASDYWLDTQVFVAVLPTDENDQIPARELEKEITHYKGPFLEGFSLPESIAFEEWLLLQREQVERGVQENFHRLVSENEQYGEWGHALSLARRWVGVAPWDEGAHQQLIRLYYQNGQRSQALAQYKRCRQLLWDELGVTPSTETEAIYEAIKTDQFDGDSILIHAASAVIPNNLPRDLTPLVGRCEEINGLVGLITDHNARLVTITGFGGTGKTRLGLAVAEHCQRHALFPDGIFFVSLVGLTSSRQIPAAICDAVQINLESGIEGLLRFLSRKRMLILLDNFEHLLDGSDLVVDILEAAPEVQLLLTSRERLGLREEQVFPLEGLSYPDGINADLVSLDAISDFESIELFLQRANLFQPGFEVLQDESSALVGICQLVAGLPLALELAAGWVDSLSLSEIEAGIKKDIDFLTTQLRDQPARHRSMGAVFNTTWERLAPAEQALFKQLSIFRGGFTRRAAQLICGGTLVSLASLVRRALSSYDRVQQRYNVHEFLRQIGADLLAQERESALAIQAGHATYFCEWLGEQDARLKSNVQKLAMSQIESDLSNVLAAVDWALEQENLVLLEKVIQPLGNYFWFRSRSDGKALFQKITDSMSLGATKQEPSQAKLYAAALVWYIQFSNSVGDFGLAQQLLDSCLDVLHGLEADTRKEQAHLQQQRGYLYYESNPGLAQVAFEESCVLYQSIGDDWGQANALLGLGRALRNLGRYHPAEEAVRQSLSLGQRIGNQVVCAEALTLLGNLARSQDHIELAEGLLRESLAMTPSRFRSLKGYTRAILGFALLDAGKFIEARDTFVESLAILTELGELSTVPAYMCGLAEAYMHLGDYKKARLKAEEGLQLSRKVDSSRFKMQTLWLQGGIALGEQRHHEAESWFQKSKEIKEHYLLKPHLDHTNPAGDGLVARGMGNLAKAKKHLESALITGVEFQDHDQVKLALFGFALLFADEGRYREAVKLHSLLNRYPWMANSSWIADIGGDYLMAVADNLPSSVAEQARQEGRNLDLWETAQDLIGEQSI